MSELPFLAGEQGRGSFLVLLFCISAAVITGWGIWEGTLPASEEAVYAETAREIAVTGDPWSPRFDGAPLLDTPPLPLWAAALSIRIFGAHEYAARLPFVLFAVLTFWIVYLAGMRTELWGSGGAARIRCGSAIGLLSAIIIAASPLYSKWAPHLTLGVPFACFAALSLLGWWMLPERRIGLLWWGIGILGGLLSAGGAGLLVIPAGLLSAVFDRRRRPVWRSPGFIVATVAAAVIGGIWPLRAALASPGGFRGSPLWGAILGFAAPQGAAAFGLGGVLKDLVIGNLPWSIPAAAAVVRIVCFRRRAGGKGRTSADDTLLVFSIVLLVPLLAASPPLVRYFLPVLPFAAILSAREISRLLAPARGPAGAAEMAPSAGGGASDVDDGASAARKSAPSAGGREFTPDRVWSLDQGLVALLCFLMLLLVATPLRLHRTDTEPIVDVALMARTLVPDGERLGNFRQGYRVQAARMLFYGDRSLGRPLLRPADVAEAVRENPRRIFFSTIGDMEELEASGAVPSGFRMLFRAGDLVLFSAAEENSGPGGGDGGAGGGSPGPGGGTGGGSGGLGGGSAGPASGAGQNPEHGPR